MNEIKAKEITQENLIRFLKDSNSSYFIHISLINDAKVQFLFRIEKEKAPVGVLFI